MRSFIQEAASPLRVRRLSVVLASNSRRKRSSASQMQRLTDERHTEIAGRTEGSHTVSAIGSSHLLVSTFNRSHILLASAHRLLISLILGTYMSVSSIIHQTKPNVIGTEQFSVRTKNNEPRARFLFFMHLQLSRGSK